MWPFTRQKNISDLPNHELHKWGVAQATHADKPMIIRYNETARNWKGHRELPVRVGFAIPFKEQTPNGLPTEDENKLINDIEDVLCNELAAEAPSILTLAITTNNMKEFVFYTTPDVNFEKLHTSCQKKVTTHEVQCMAETDPKWRVYKEYTPS